jgi:hypothetical protein
VFTVRGAAIVLMLLMTVPARAEMGAPTLLVLSLSGDSDQLALETEVVTQLKLELDDLRIEQKDVSKTIFVEASLQDKLKVIARMPQQKNVVAACWIETRNNRSILLYMMALRTGRSAMRVIEADKGPRFAEELAFLAQELLGQLYWAKPPEKTVAVKAGVGGATDETGASLVKRKRLQFSVTPFGQITGTNPGKWLAAGGGIWGELRVHRGLFFVLSVAGMGMPLADPSDGRVSGAAFVPGVEVGYTWWAGAFGAGLNVGATLGYTKLKMVIGPSGKTDVGFFDPAATAGVDLRFEVSDILSVVLSPALAIRFHTRDVRRVSDHSVIVSTFLANWSLRTGLQFGF